MSFEEAYSKFWQEFGESRVMVLSTSIHDVVTSRAMSVVALGEKLYFQTDETLRKYQQLKENPNAALCIDNIQIEGQCRDVGKPADNIDFCKSYQKHFPNPYRRYLHLKNQRLLMFTPTFIERWLYIDGDPYTEVFDIVNKKHILQEYRGV